MPACSNVLRAPPPAQRVLVIRLGALGDVLRTLPAVAGIRDLYPTARISWLVEPPAAAAAALSPGVDEVIVFPRRELSRALRSGRLDRLVGRLRLFIATLREPRFDLVVDFHGILKSGLQSRLTGAATRIGYAPPFAREGNWLFSTHRANLGRARISRFDRNAGLVEFMGGTVDVQDRAFLEIPEAAKDQVAPSSPGDSRRGVILHPGTSAGTAYKRWPTERFAALAGRIASETDAPCWVIAGPGPTEARLACEVVARSGGAAQHAPATRDISELAARIGSARLFVGGDTGPLHLAALLGTPAVQILGPTDPIENAPFPRTPNRTLRVPVPCSPCRRGCASPVCMEAVSVEAVAAAARILLSSESVVKSLPPWRAA